MNKHLCPVCGKYEFSKPNSFEICEVCGWQNDRYQENNPDEEDCANEISLNEAKRRYENGTLDLLPLADDNEK